MAISFEEAIRSLLDGQQLGWAAFAEHKAGALILGKPEERRLFNFLLTHEREKVVRGDEELFDGLIAAWENDGFDPVEDEKKELKELSLETWRLELIEASGFGGLTLFEGTPFRLEVHGENWCLYGQNGSGKTSLASAIIWALTGKRIREQEGPIYERGERSVVSNEIGKKLGDWPSFASYPTAIPDLIKPVEVWVRLTFVNRDSDSAIAYRRMVCPVNGDPTSEVMIDPRLLTKPELLETGLLMPARLARIGFGDKSGSLFEAVKVLTGLDQLADIADGCSQFTHGGRRFLKYAKEKGLERWETQFKEEMGKALEKAEELSFVLPEKRTLGAPTLVAALNQAVTNASGQAGAYLATLKSEIASTLDTSTTEGRLAIRKAVGMVRVSVNQGIRDIALFEAWTALKAVKNDTAFASLPETIAAARTKLDRALAWHDKQKLDEKFRLKALAAKFFVLPHEHSGSAQCPLCTAFLSTTEQKALATQLIELQQDAVEAERQLDDVCLGLEADLIECLPANLQQHRTLLATMDPKISYGVMIRERFCEKPEFGDVLLGLVKRIDTRVMQQETVLPNFSFAAFEPGGDEPQSATSLRLSLHNFDRLLALVVWWCEHHDVFLQSWSELIGQKQEDGTYPVDSVEGQLFALEEALANAEPLDILSKVLLKASEGAENWAMIRKEQDLREAIAKALAPLKDLRLLVAAETARSISNLSERIKKILDRIHLNERLTYEQTTLGKKIVHVGGSFAPGMRIDAALVANTSWLRAILWAFILALREETLESLGANPFPLMVLDDPQTSFDPRNKRKWAEELARLGNIERTEVQGLQLFLTTYEREFYQCMVDVERLEGEQGLIGGVNKTSGVVTVVNASCLERV